MQFFKKSMPVVYRRTLMFLLGVILSFLILEAGIRLGGFVYQSIQDFENRRAINRKGTYRILCLGESTTQGAYPQPLEIVLNERNIGIRFSVIDKGMTGTNTPAILSRLKSFLDESQPDLVVAMMGINDRGIKYYEDIPDSDTWLFRHCRVYRLGRVLIKYILKRGYHHEGEGSPPSRKIDLEFIKTVSNKPKILEGAEVRMIDKIDFNNKNPKPESDNKVYEIKEPLSVDADADIKKDQKGIYREGVFISQSTSSQAEDLYENAKISQAEGFIRKAIELNPKNVNAYAELACLFQSQGRFSQAEECLKKSIEVNPESYEANLHLGRFYRDSHLLSKAEDSFKRAIRLNPDYGGFASAYVELGLIYRTNGIHDDFIQAESLFIKAIEANPKNENAYIELGLFYQTRGEFFRAENAFKKALTLGRASDRAYFVLGALFQQQGKPSQAVDAYRRAIEINPQYERALRALASLDEENGRSKLAGDYSAVTIQSYRKLKAILDRQGIRLICAQYPMRSLKPLQNIFDGESGVAFVDNEQIFKHAVKNTTYSEFFTDNFAGDFGHCTPKGNKLLAKNIADVILEQVFAVRRTARHNQDLKNDAIF